MLLPENFSGIVKERQGNDNAILKFSMVSPENQSNTNLSSWSLASVSDKKLVIKLNFKNPLEVSQEDEADQLLIYIRMSEWTT